MAGEANGISHPAVAHVASHPLTLRTPALDYLPLFARLGGRPCLVVGAGEVGLRKARTLLAAGAQVTVVAPAACEALASLAAAGKLCWRRGTFDPVLVEGQLLVIAATGRPDVDAQVQQAANRAGRLVNVVDDAARCSYIFPAIVDRSPIVVAISSGGTAPVLARLLRERLEALLPASLGRLAALAGRWRGRVGRQALSFVRRRRYWERVLDGDIASLVHAGREVEAEQAMARALDEADAGGCVYLVGAGPGDPGLLTLRALQVMQRADVILHDRLVSPGILALARRDARLVSVGKQPGGRAHDQAAINARLVAEAREGRRVCRLKGGDPFVFGRGGEELEALHAAGVAFEVVPGITAAVGCAAYAGVPLTHRDHNSAVTLVTAHCRESVECLDWAELARPGHMLAVYMGVGQVPRIREALLSHGRAAATPVAFVENGTTRRQRVVRSTLGSMHADAARERVAAPAMLFIGEGAALAGTLGWFQSQPESGTGAAARSLALAG